ncbi:MAG: outer membrane protein assembly factor BamE [Methylophilaceae bacterium]|uniref:outer membrane protein assembly factor BamE n=1 Tax=Methylovorus sp. MM2 TaxID=1848038 RepID=UPI0020B70162|nr:outer membrane protein assembly factor BamE [Methylovorus sp. MM2]
MRQTIILIALFCAACISAGCSSSLPSFRPYKMDIQQGNVVTSKMMLQLRPDMTRSQVRFVMGTPLIQDSFHKDRWDYFYQMRKDGRIIEQRRIILEFEGDALKRVRGDVVPATEGAPATAEAPAKAGEKKGLADKLQFWKSADPVDTPRSAPAELVNPDLVNPPAKKAPAPVADPATSSMPPLEPPPSAKSGVNVNALPDNAPAAVALPPETAPASKSAPAAAKTETAKPASQPDAQPKPAAAKPAPVEEEPDADLPPEDAPGYFERMLEKIGF